MRTVTILDGGMGHELKLRGIVTDGSFLAGIVANVSQPKAVERVHRDFCLAGCDFVTTNSFVAVPTRMKKGIGNYLNLEEILEEKQEETTEFLTLATPCITTDDTMASQQSRKTAYFVNAAVKCARRAVEQFSGKKVAGCIPPLFECYKPSEVPQDLTSIIPGYDTILSSLMHLAKEGEDRSWGVDVLLAETLSTSREAVAIIYALSKISLMKQQRYSSSGVDDSGSDDKTMSKKDNLIKSPPLWLCFTVDDECPTHLRSGESLKSAFSIIFENAKKVKVQLAGIGVNCSSPRAISIAVPMLRLIADSYGIKDVLAYANAFRTTTSEWLRNIDVTIPITDIVDHKNDTGNRKQTQLENALSACDTTEFDPPPQVSKLATNSKPGENGPYNQQKDQEYDDNGCIYPEVYATYAMDWIGAGATVVGGCCGCVPHHIKAVVAKLNEQNMKGIDNKTPL